jgi:transcriptional regulator
MYIPKHFSEDDLATLHTLMRDYSFATLISSQDDGVPVATPLPFVVDTHTAPYGRLYAHMALGNSQWRTFKPGREVLVIFQGPHAYITPSWYEEPLSVPTWDYATVHAYGLPRVIEDHKELYRHLKSLVEQHERQFEEQWRLDSLPDEYIEKMMRGVVGFEIEITRLQGKFKMSQNRSESERARVSQELRASQNPILCEVGELVAGVRKRAE